MSHQSFFAHLADIRKQARHATRDARVIAYTGTPMLDDTLVERLFAAVLPKPPTPDVVLATARHVASF